MKYFFFVQSEGRGHMSQALALKEQLEEQGHQVIAATIGLGPNQEIPSFFKDNIGCPIINVESPKFLIDKEGKGVRLVASVINTIKKVPNYLNSVRKIKKSITNLNPDVLVSFYEPLAGAYYRFCDDKRPMFCIGHQFLASASSFKFPPSNFFSKNYFQFYNFLVSGKRTTKIALSFDNEPDELNKKLFICPPLIRKSIKLIQPSNNSFILSYMINFGYAKEIISWHQANPDYKIEAFWNKPGEEHTRIDDKLNFYHLSGQRFIDLLASCEAYVGTAGFDSVAEAAYLQKNILLIPTKNHFEQECNAYDAQRAKIAISSNIFNFSLLQDKAISHSPIYLKKFKEWVDNFDGKIIEILTKNN